MNISKLLLILAMLFPVHAFAACNDDVISQMNYTSQKGECMDCSIDIVRVLPNPEGNDDGEFIEIAFKGGKSFSLLGWKLTDGSKTYMFPDAVYLNTTVKLEKNVTGISLNNTGKEEVSLVDNTDYVVATFAYTDPIEGAVYEKIDGNIMANIDVSIENLAKESEKTDNVFNTSTFQFLQITEIFPNPEGADGGNEFVELFNSGTTTLSLEGLFLDDAEGQSKPYDLSGYHIKPLQYLIIYSEDSGLQLNNSSDAVRVLTSDKQAFLTLEYSNVFENQSYMRIGDEYVWSPDISPGYENVVYVAENEEQLTDELYIAELTEDYVGKDVSIKGVVNVKPGTFSSQYFYIEDESGGIQIYMYTKDFPDLVVGDTVMVTGEVSFSQGYRIKVKNKEDIVVTGSSGLLPEIFDPLDSFSFGKLRYIIGKIESWKKDEIVVDGITIRVKSGVSLDKIDNYETTSVKILGIVLSYKDEPVIYPRGNDDISVIEIVNTTSTEPIYSTSTASSPDGNSGGGAGLSITKDPPYDVGYMLYVLTALTSMYVVTSYFYAKIRKKTE